MAYRGESRLARFHIRHFVMDGVLGQVASKNYARQLYISSPLEFLA